MLSLERRSGLPPLAWLLNLNGDTASLMCGTSVAVRDDAFVEGAWAGRFEDWGFDACRDVFGSGGRRTSSGWLLVTPSHTLECIFLLRTQRRGWVASNSLAFLQAWTDARFVLPSRRLAPVFVGIVDGIEESPITLETTAGTLTALYHHNCLLTSNGLEVRPKSLPPRFPDYSAYVAYLREAVSLVASNAATPERRRSYRLLATLSSGYDSPTCAVLSKEAGCEEAITFVMAREGVPDDGTRIGEYLNLSVVPLDRPEDTHDLPETELEFLATGMHAEDVIFAAASDQITNRVLVTGFHGDRIWDIDSDPSSVLARGNISGSSMGEFRLARDFVHLPLPFVGAQQDTDIARISRSEELRPYSIEGKYDRPIPRRIVEEAGVPRESFGRSKKAVSLLVFVENDLLSAETRGAVRERIGRFDRLDRALYDFDYRWFRLAMRCHELLPRWQKKLPGPARPLYGRASRNVL